MRTASMPLNEELRLHDLHSLEILDTPPEKEFDDLVALVAQIFACPIAGIGFLDKERIWFKSAIGLDITEFPRNMSFCAHTLLTNEVVVVSNALHDKRFQDHPSVTGASKIRFYAGASIVSASGQKLGTICVVDQKPREISKEDTNTLKVIAAQVARLLDLRQKNTLLRKTAEHLLQAEKKLAQKTFQEQERERTMIGRELHENIAQGLAATKLFLEMAEEKPGHSYIQKGIDNVSKMIQQVRELSWSITPSTMQQYGLEELLDQLVQRFAVKTGIPAELDFHGKGKLHPNLCLALYRITEEQLNNIEKHANASLVRLIVEVEENISLSICDDGVGFDLQQFRKGFGMGKIISLSEYFGGHVNLVALINGGCRLHINLPSLLVQAA